MTSPTPIPAQPLSYGVEAPRPGAKVFAAAVIVAAGLALIVLGGCFMIGIMMLLSGPKYGGSGAYWSTATYVYLCVLYVLAFACFGGAVALIVAGLRSLFVVLRG
jgi:hypothetical protein